MLCCLAGMPQPLSAVTANPKVQGCRHWLSGPPRIGSGHAARATSAPVPLPGTRRWRRGRSGRYRQGRPFISASGL